MSKLRQLSRRAIVATLGVLARAILRRYHPRVVAITGSVGKTTTKELIACVLSSRYKLRAAPGSYNSEFGVPLTVLGEQVPRSVSGWLAVLQRGLSQLIRKVDYPELLVLEMGADHPGDINYLTSLAPPDVAVVTNVHPNGVHSANYESGDQLVAEKSELIRNLKTHGVAILNVDNTETRMMRPLAPDGVIYYGLSPDANVWISDIAHAPGGMTGTFNVAETEGSLPQTWLLRTSLLGRHQMYGVAAAVATGLALEVPVGEALSAVADFTPPPGRGRILIGRHGLRIIDDTYNASPQATLDAVATLRQLPGPRWAVLGDMAELGTDAAGEHRRIGENLAPWLDQLVVIGELASHIVEGAQAAGMSAGRIHRVVTVDEAITMVDPEGNGGTVLVKASQPLYLERVVEGLLLDPRDKRLLVDRLGDPAHRRKLTERI